MLLRSQNELDWDSKIQQIVFVFQSLSFPNTSTLNASKKDVILLFNFFWTAVIQSSRSHCHDGSKSGNSFSYGLFLHVACGAVLSGRKCFLSASIGNHFVSFHSNVPFLSKKLVYQYRWSMCRFHCFFHSVIIRPIFDRFLLLLRTKSICPLSKTYFNVLYLLFYDFIIKKYKNKIIS